MANVCAAHLSVLHVNAAQAQRSQCLKHPCIHIQLLGRTLVTCVVDHDDLGGCGSRAVLLVCALDFDAAAAATHGACLELAFGGDAHQFEAWKLFLSELSVAT